MRTRDRAPARPETLAHRKDSQLVKTRWWRGVSLNTMGGGQNLAASLALERVGQGAKAAYFGRQGGSRWMSGLMSGWVSGQAELAAAMWVARAPTKRRSLSKRGC